MDSRKAQEQLVQSALPSNMMMGPSSYPSSMPTSNASSMINPNSISMMAAGARFPFNSMLQSASGQLDSLNPGPYDGSPPGLRPCGLNIESPKKKRGRPRKYAPEGNIALGLATAPVSASMSRGGEGSSTPSSEPPAKRNRGRPPGSGKKQLDAMGAGGTGWTPHVIKVDAGEDITSKINAFSHQGPRAVCILSATGTICKATLRKDPISSGVVNYEGAFDIISLSGSFFLSENDDCSTRTSDLCVLLGGPDTRVIGGRVAGPLMAVTPVQVILGSFTLNVKKTNSTVSESGPSSAPPPNMSNLSAPSIADSPQCRQVSSDSSDENGQCPMNGMPPGFYGNASQGMQHMQMYHYGMGQSQQ